MSGFDLVQRRRLPSLQATVFIYRHAATHAEHVHLATDEPEMVFLVGFPTLPTKSDGRAHVLEHVLLCGSERFPVKDPFFSMMRRSVSTFMNAMTFPDRTLYPFATTDRLDYFNLLDVYLDATFFPRLDRLSFLQEGWRLSLDESGHLDLGGVVLNEMKGAYSDPFHAVHRGLMRELFAGTTYAVDFGGDPLDMPLLSHEALRQFHATHYHPSQAIFMTSGPVDPVAVQEAIANQVLSRFDAAASSVRLVPPLVEPWAQPRRTLIRVPASASPETEHGLQMAWVLDDTADLLARLRTELVVETLLGHAGAPVMRALQAMGYGRPSRLLGSDDSTRQLLLHMGMEGLAEDQVDAAEACIVNTLKNVADNGVSIDALRASQRALLHRYRQSMSPVERLIGVAQVPLRGGHLLDEFDPEPALATLATEAESPEFIQRQVSALLAAPTCLVAHVQPQLEFYDARDAMERAWLAEQQERLDPEQIARLQVDAGALEQYHNSQPNEDLLPRVRSSDLARTPRCLPVDDLMLGDVHTCRAPTRGLVHCEFVVDVSSAPQHDWGWLRLYAELLPQLGVANMGYAEAAAWRLMRTPDFDMRLAQQPLVGGGSRLELTYSVSALREELLHVPEVITAWFATPNLLEDDRLEFLLRTEIRTAAASLAENASQFAELAAKAAVSSALAFDHETRGLPSLQFLAQLARLLVRTDGLAQVRNGLQRMHEHLQAGARALLCVGTENDASNLAKAMTLALPACSAPPAAHATEAMRQEADTRELAVLAPSQVNHCAAAFAAPTYEHPDAPALAVAAMLLTQQLLHPMLREQGGAYGAQATYDSLNGVVSLATHQDPRLADTYRDFERAVEALQNDDFADDALEQAVLGVVQRIDAPQPPFPDIERAWRMRRRGVSDAQRQRYRTGVLQCSSKDVRAAARRWFKWEGAARAAAVGNAQQDLAGLPALDLLRHADVLELRA